MKKRRVVLTIEIETSESVADLKQSTRVCLEDMMTKVLQVQANVIKAEKGKR